MKDYQCNEVMEENRCKHIRTDDGCRWCELGYMLQCDRCRELKGNEEE